MRRFIFIFLVSFFQLSAQNDSMEVLDSIPYWIQNVHELMTKKDKIGAYQEVSEALIGDSLNQEKLLLRASIFESVVNRVEAELLLSDAEVLLNFNPQDSLYQSFQNKALNFYSSSKRETAEEIESRAIARMASINDYAFLFDYYQFKDPSIGNKYFQQAKYAARKELRQDSSQANFWNLINTYKLKGEGSFKPIEAIYLKAIEMYPEDSSFVKSYEKQKSLHK